MHEVWVRVYRKLAERTGDRSIRAMCRRECARHMADLASRHSASGDHRRCLRALMASLRHNPARGATWIVMLKSLVRAVTPSPC